MPDGSLPSLTPEKVIRALKKCGFVELRQKGSHLILFNEHTKKRVVVPMHKGKDIKKPLLRKIIELEAHLFTHEDPGEVVGITFGEQPDEFADLWALPETVVV